MIRRFGAVPLPDRRYTMRPGAYAILALGHDVLLTHQAFPVPEFQLPGGGIDAGESPIVALHREVFEETGWRIANIRRLGAFRRFTFMPEYDLWAEKLCTVYVARPTLPVSRPTEPGHTAVWMTAQQAVRELGNPGDSHMMQRWLGCGQHFQQNR